MFLMLGPERYSAPPVETWMMPSEPASAKPLRAAFSVCELDTLMAGYAKEPAFARSSMSAYTSGVAMGMAPPAVGEGVHDPRRSCHGCRPVVVTVPSADERPLGRGRGTERHHCARGSKTYGVVVATRCRPSRLRMGSES